MKYREDPDQFAAGFDAGSIIDGKVEQDPATGEWVIVDEEGYAFSLQRALSKYPGQSVRVTCVSSGAMENLQKLLAEPGN